MHKKYKIAILLSVFIAITLAFVLFLFTQDIAVLNPKGWIAAQQRNLMINATLLMLIVVIPVFVLLLFFVWRYHGDNSKAKYTPDWEHQHTAEVLWWGIPTVIIVLLAWITWTSSHELDPFKPLAADKPPLKIQVIALNWKWLFIYPEQEIASINFVQFPENTPIDFEITADAPMNSFWIPQLGGQIYAMPAMKTQLHLIANEQGDFRGSSAHISGKGFAGMSFIARATSQETFNAWIKSVQNSSPPLNLTEYDRLVEPSENNKPAVYVLKQPGLFDQVVMKYKIPRQ